MLTSTLIATALSSAIVCTVSVFRDVFADARGGQAARSSALTRVTGVITAVSSLAALAVIGG